MTGVMWAALAGVGMFLLLCGYIALDIWASTRRRTWLTIMLAGWLIGVTLFAAGVHGLTSTETHPQQRDHPLTMC